VPQFSILIIVPRRQRARFAPCTIPTAAVKSVMPSRPSVVALGAEVDDQILSLYGRGMSTQDSVATFKEMYDADVSAGLISKVTDAVLERVVEWQSRPLDNLYPIVFLDCIVLKIRQYERGLSVFSC